MIAPPIKARTTCCTYLPRAVCLTGFLSQPQTVKAAQKCTWARYGEPWAQMIPAKFWQNPSHKCHRAETSANEAKQALLFHFHQSDHNVSPGGSSRPVGQPSQDSRTWWCNSFLATWKAEPQFIPCIATSPSNSFLNSLRGNSSVTLSWQSTPQSCWQRFSTPSANLEANLWFWDSRSQRHHRRWCCNAPKGHAHRHHASVWKPHTVYEASLFTLTCPPHKYQADVQEVRTQRHT